MFAEDLAPFFAVEGFATEATVGGAAVRVLFERPYADPFGAALDSSQPQCWVPSASVANVRQGAAVVIGGSTYKVERVEPDGTGISRIVMHPTT